MYADLTRRLPSFLIYKTQDKDSIAERQYCRERREAKEQVGQMFIAKHIFRRLRNGGILGGTIRKGFILLLRTTKGR